MASEVAEYRDAIGSLALNNCGIPADDYAAEWRDAGIPVNEVSDWIESGTWDADSAAMLRDAGITPSQAGMRCPEGPCEGETIGYAVSNGDLSVERAVELSSEAP